MELKLWGSHKSLPSIDCECLRAMSYAKFCGAPVNTSECNNPWISPNGQLPVFTHGPKVKITAFSDFKSYLRKQHFSADVSLTNNQVADIVAYEALLKNKLKPALTYILWCDPRNYVEFIRPWYAKHLSFPLNYFIPGQMQRLAQEVIGSLHEFKDLEEQQIENYVYKNAQECFLLLSERLGDNDFFFGKSPCSLDATVFGYLTPIFKLDELPNAALCNHLKLYPNLVQFITRILQRYFSQHNSSSRNAFSENKNENSQYEKPKENPEIDEFPHKWRNIFLSGMFSLSAMVVYALTTGLLQVSYVAADDDFEDEEEQQENR